MTDARSDLAHLYRRAGFGARPDELDAAVAGGYEATVESLLAGLSGPDAAGDGVALPALTMPAAAVRRTDPTAAKQRRQDENREEAALQAWWLDRMISTATPLREKLTLLWSGHFATGFDKVRNAALMHLQNQLFRTLGGGSFQALTTAVAKDPAMQLWLDTATDVAAHPNENFARELMELFTLGVGNYTETDVQEAARCFTGWSFNRTTGVFVLRPRVHDNGQKTVLGQTGDLDGDDLVRIVTNAPASHRFVVARLWSHLAYPVGPTDPVVGQLTPGYGRDLDITNLLRAIFLHPAFRSAAARSGLVKQPIEYAVGVARAFGLARHAGRSARAGTAIASHHPAAPRPGALQSAERRRLAPERVLADHPQRGHPPAVRRPGGCHRRPRQRLGGSRRPAPGGIGPPAVDRRVEPDDPGRPRPRGRRSAGPGRPRPVRPRVRRQLSQPLSRLRSRDRSMRHLSRRQFLAGSGVVAGSAMAAAALARHPWSAASPAVRRSGPGPAAKGTLVLVTLYGGNDGLNTVIPYADPRYAAARPTLGYTPDQVLPLAEGLGLHPSMKGLKALWDAKRLAVVLGVGYPDPVLSHFRSMDIWQTASPSAPAASGWLGRWLDATGTDPMRAISIGPTLPVLLTGTKQSGTAISGSGIKIAGGARVASSLPALWAPGADRQGQAARVAASGADLLSVQHTMADLLATPSGGAPSAPVASGLAGQLALVARLILAGAPTRVYQVSLGGFDNHAAEKATHARLLSVLDDAVAAFFTTLHDAPQASGVTLVTYSEFGRRVAENGSDGTDHGTAAPMLVAGPSVKGALYGAPPSLADLDDGNLRFTTDFRSVYASVLQSVIGVDPKVALSGTFPTLGFL